MPPLSASGFSIFFHWVPSPTCFAFQAPPSYAVGLRRSGFTLMNVANNHFADYGGEGEAETVGALPLWDFTSPSGP